MVVHIVDYLNMDLSMTCCYIYCRIDYMGSLVHLTYMGYLPHKDYQDNLNRKGTLQMPYLMRL